MARTRQPMTLRTKVGRTIARIAAIVGVVQLITAVIVNIASTIFRRHRVPSGFPYVAPQTAEVEGNAMTVYTYGAHLFDEMIAAIDAAKDHVYLETFIWKSDEVGERFKDAVIRAANRGVKVCLIWDVFANMVVPRKFFSFPKNIMTYPFPLIKGGIKFMLLRNSGRDHRKILVIDNKIGFVGGYNIGSLYEHKWRDTHMKVAGSFASELEATFVTMWNHSKKNPPLPIPPSQPWLAKIQLYCNIPQVVVYPIRNMYMDAIRKAKKTVWLTHAYFLPDADLMTVLTEAAERGVDVSLIIPEVSNHPLTDWLSRAHYDRLLSSGIRIFLYEGAMIHSKTATIDSVWSTIGTANLDRVSLAGNYEINVEIVDQDMSAIMEEVFQTDLGNCRELSLDDWRKRSKLSQVAETILKPLSQLI